MKHFLALVLILACVPVSCKRRWDTEFDTSVSSPGYPTSGPKVAFDEGHHNFHTSRGTYRPFVELLKNDGYRVSAIDDLFTPEVLSRFEVLVIANAKSTNETSAASALSEAEVSAVDQWVRGGGGLLLITDHYPYGSAVEDLGGRFGISMSKGMTFDPVHHDREARDDSQLVFSRENGLLSSHTITEGRSKSERVERVVTFTGQSIRGAQNAAPLLQLSATAVNRAPNPKIRRSGSTTRVEVDFGPPTSAADWAQAIALQHGQGRVVVTAEAAMFSAQRDGGRRIGMNLPTTQNRQFALNVMHWLSKLQ